MIDKVVRGLRRTYEYVMLFGSLALFGVLALLYSILGVALYPLLPRRFGARTGRLMMTGLCRFYLAVIQGSGNVRCDLSALDALSGEEAIIIASNHPSLIDVILLGSRLPNIVCIMKAEIGHNLLFGGGALLSGYIRNNSTGNMVRSAVAELKRGSQLLIFPEGTRTTRQPINDFKSAFALIARKARAPVQTVYIETNTPFLGKGWPLLKKPQFPLYYRVALGKRFSVGDDPRALVVELEHHFREQLAGRQQYIDQT